MPLTSSQVQIALAGPTIVFDGKCVLCSRVVSCLVRSYPDIKLMWGQDPDVAEFLRTKLAICPQDFDKSWVVIHKNKIYRKTDAIGFILQHSQHWFVRLFGLLIIFVPKFIRDWVYGLVATNRYGLFGKSDSCIIPNCSDGRGVASRFIHEI